MKTQKNSGEFKRELVHVQKTLNENAKNLYFFSLVIGYSEKGSLTGQVIAK